MKLKSLRLTNLLSHEDAHIELGEFLAAHAPYLTLTYDEFVAAGLHNVKE